MPYLVARPKPASQPFFTPQPSTLWDSSATNSLLINAGSTTADQIGLYHYTTQTNQVKEAGSIVDIGYHYVAGDGYGNPIDTNGDGVPDYLQDSNGNGIFDIGEISDWQTYNSGSGLTGGNGLVVFTPLK